MKTYNEVPNKELPNVVIYHANCTDGFCSAWVAQTKLPPTNLVLQAVSYGEKIDFEILRHKNIFIVDFSFPRQTLLAIQEIASYLVVLDHHKTAQMDLNDLSFAVFDMDKSGAGLTWDYFYPGIPVTPLIQYVEDYDLWRFKLAGSREINAGIQSHTRTIENFNMLDNALSSDSIQELWKLGEHLLRQKEHLCCSLFANGYLQILFPGYDKRLPIVNCLPALASICGDLFLKKTPEQEVVMLWWLNEKMEVLLSFRSVKEFDCSVLARSFGGGGHKNAAGAKISYIHWAHLLEEQPQNISTTEEKPEKAP